MRRSDWVFLPAIAYGILIFFLSSRPGDELPTTPTVGFPVDKIVHTLEYALLALLIYAGVRWSRRPFSNQTFALSLTICIVYAATDEIHQMFVPGRDGNMGDLVADAIGALIVLLPARYFQKSSD